MHSVKQFLLLLITIFVSSFSALCIPLKGFGIDWARPILATVIFSCLSFITERHGPSVSAPASTEINKENTITIDTESPLLNAGRMLLSSLLAGGNASVQTPFYTTGAFASIIGIESIFRTLEK